MAAFIFSRELGQEPAAHRKRAHRECCGSRATEPCFAILLAIHAGSGVTGLSAVGQSAGVACNDSGSPVRVLAHTSLLSCRS